MGGRNKRKAEKSSGRRRSKTNSKPYQAPAAAAPRGGGQGQDYKEPGPVPSSSRRIGGGPGHSGIRGGGGNNAAGSGVDVPKSPRWWEEGEGGGFERMEGDEVPGMVDRPAIQIDPFAIVPEVVLREHLLKFLEDPKDRLSLVRVSPAVEKLLEGSKASLYLCSMFALPNFRRCFPEGKLLELRQVCKEWKFSIDQALDASLNMEPNYRSYQSILKSPSTLALTFGRKTFLRTFKSFSPPIHYFQTLGPLLQEIRSGDRQALTLGNPFVAKRASFFFTTGNENRTFWGNLLTLLGRFGRDLRSMLIFSKEEEDMSAMEQLGKFRECLEKAPFLTTLDFSFIQTREWKKNGKMEHLQVPTSLWLPSLPNLTRLFIEFDKLSFYEPFLNYFDQLVSLFVRECEDFMEWLQPSEHSTFPKMKHLAVQVNKEDQLLKLTSLTSPLTDLHISCGVPNTHPSVLFYLAGHFKGTLSSFRIDQGFDCHEELKGLSHFGFPKPQHDRINLPHLKTLSLTATECGFGNVDLLLKLSHPPEYLEIMVDEFCHNKGSCRGDQEGALQIHRNWGRMYSSNIWTLLPFLKEIFVLDRPFPWGDGWDVRQRKDRYTRHMYEVIQIQAEADEESSDSDISIF